MIHGVYVGIHCAKKHVDEFQGSVIFGHTHRVQSHIAGERAGFNIGCTCDKESKGFKYMPLVQRRKWCNAFGIAHIDDSGDYHVETVQAYDGNFVLNGKLY